MYFKVKLTGILLAFLSLQISGGLPAPQFDSTLSNQRLLYNYQPQSSVHYFPNEINKPIFHPELGMYPQYHDLVYNYVKDFAGTEAPAHVNTFQPNFVLGADHFLQRPEQNGNFEDKIAAGSEYTKPTAGGVPEVSSEQPNLNDYFLPSDLFSPNQNPNNQFYGNFDAVKTNTVKFGAQPTSLPPIGGVISDYVLLRSQSDPKNLLQLPGTVKDEEKYLQHIKRQIPDDSDGVVILAEPLQNTKASEDMAEHKEDTDGNKEEEQSMEAHPGIAQSKPSAIALAGPGGVAQASPVGTALVGQGGLAVAAPSGTAVAGPAGQGAIPIQVGEGKQKTTEKSEESDGY